MLSKIDMSAVREHYDRRKVVSRQLRQHMSRAQAKKFVELALGITDPEGNYSAAEHNLGPQILGSSSFAAVFGLAQALDGLTKNTHVPETIYAHGIPFLKISVGSEIACLLHPSKFWVGNVRTIWSHLLLKHAWDHNRANTELDLFRQGDIASEMNYRVWRDVYLALESSMKLVANLGATEAKKQGVVPGKATFLWADAVANALYEE